MKQLIKIEEAFQLGLCIYALTGWQSPWWCYVLLALGPDISMLGYAGGNRFGALTYNFFHHKAVAIILFVVGLLGAMPVVTIAGIILYGHSSMDRMFGYGLKTKEGFKFTHLGMIGKPVQD